MADYTTTVEVALGGTLTTVPARGYSCSGGRRRQFEAFPAGQCRFEIHDIDGDYVPEGGGLWSNEKWIGREVRVTFTAGGVSNVIWRGHVEDIDVRLADYRHAVVAVTAVEPTAKLGRAIIDASTSFSAELSSERIDNVLALSEVDDGYFTANTTDITTGETTLQSEADAGGNALQYLQLVERSEGGRLFVRHGGSGGGVLAFRPRNDNAAYVGVKLNTGAAADLSLVDGGTAATQTFTSTYDGGTAASDFGCYVELNGSATQEYVELDSPQLGATDIDVTIDVSLDDWTPSSSQFLWDDQDSSTSTGLGFYVTSGGNLAIISEGTVNINTALGLSDGSRHTIRVLYDGGAGTIETYVDGALHDTETVSIPASISASGDATLMLGRFDSGSYLEGKIYSVSASYDGSEEVNLDFSLFPDGTTSGFSAGATFTVVGGSTTCDGVGPLDGGDAASVVTVPLKTASLSFSSDLLTNRATFQRDGGTAQTAEDTVSQSRYGIRPVSQTGLLNSTDPDVLSLAERRVEQFAYPAMYVETATVQLSNVTDSQAAVAASLTVGDRVRAVSVVPGTNGARTIASTARIEQVTHDSVPANHLMTLRLTPAPSQPAVYDTDVYDGVNSLYGV